MFKATILSESKAFPIRLKGEEIYLDEELLAADIKRLNENTFHVLLNNKSFLAELITLDLAEKKCTIRINGNHYSMVVQDPFADLLAKLGIDRGATQKISELKAPMPGLVLSIAVKEGDVLKKDDNLLTLEAMKMENIIKSPGEVTVKSIRVKLGDKVEKNQVLIQF